MKARNVNPDLVSNSLSLTPSLFFIVVYISGKKNNTAEKPLPSAEPPEQVLPGSLAIGSVSLAVAKTGAQVQGIPLYKYIAALKNTKVNHISTNVLYIHTKPILGET